MLIQHKILRINLVFLFVILKCYLHGAFASLHREILNLIFDIETVKALPVIKMQ